MQQSAQPPATQRCLLGSSLREGMEGRGWSGLCSLPPGLQGHSELPALCCGIAPPATSQCAVTCWEGRWVGPTAHAHCCWTSVSRGAASTGPDGLLVSVCLLLGCGGSVGGTPGTACPRRAESPTHSLSGGRAVGCPRPASLPGHLGTHYVVCTQPRHGHTRATAPSRVAGHTDRPVTPGARS